MKRIEFRYKYFSKEEKEGPEKEKKKDEDLGDLAKFAAGTGLLIGGSKIVKKNKSKVTGLENFWHSADESTIDSIKENGLKTKYSEDPNNLANSLLGKNIDKSKLKGKVYLGRKKSVADEVGLSRDINHSNGLINNKNYRGKSKTLKVNIPYEELKKMKEVDNPELRGARNAKEHAKNIWKNVLKNTPEEAKLLKKAVGRRGRNIYARVISESIYKDLSRKGTAVFENDIDSKYIKESKNYKKYGLDQFKDYVKKNPKRFAKGIGKSAVGLGLGITGAVLIGKSLKGNKKKEKEQNRKEED